MWLLIISPLLQNFLMQNQYCYSLNYSIIAAMALSSEKKLFVFSVPLRSLVSCAMKCNISLSLFFCKWVECCWCIGKTRRWEEQQPGVQFSTGNTNGELKVGGEVTTVLTLVSAQRREKYSRGSSYSQFVLLGPSSNFTLWLQRWLGFISLKSKDIVLRFGSWDGERRCCRQSDAACTSRPKKPDCPIPALNVISCHGVWICQAV